MFIITKKSVPEQCVYEYKLEYCVKFAVPFESYRLDKFNDNIIKEQLLDIAKKEVSHLIPEDFIVIERRL